MSTLPPFHLKPTFARRTWGRKDLSPWYLPSVLPESKPSDEPFGEAWLTGPTCVVAEGVYAGKTLDDVAHGATADLLGANATEAEFPLLIKLLFPDAKLSVQVHPNDEEAQARGLSRGKTECWYVLAAEPGATVACGLKPGATIEELRTAITDGTAENLLQMLPVTRGDMVFVDAGTVHAIGPGVTLLEIQQTSDTTYRLYDYGRPRELHLDEGLAVSKTETTAGKRAPQPLLEGDKQGTRLIAEKYFTVDSFKLGIGDTLPLKAGTGRPQCITALYGDAAITVTNASIDDTQIMLPAGSSAIIPTTTGDITIKAGTDVEIVRSMA